VTQAVCFKCGVIKFGAFVACPECSAAPQTEDDLALSLAMTDHYFDVPTLEQMGAAVRDGHSPHLDPQTHAKLIETIRQSSEIAKSLGASVSPDEKASRVGDQRPQGKPWWKFW
jgi:hypothetical protein